MFTSPARKKPDRCLFGIIINDRVFTTEYESNSPYGNGENIQEIVSELLLGRNIKLAKENLKELCSVEYINSINTGQQWECYHTGELRTKNVFRSVDLSYDPVRDTVNSYMRFSINMLKKVGEDPMLLMRSAYPFMEVTKIYKDSSICKWGYILNFDKGIVEIYKGDQYKNHDNGRFSETRFFKRSEPRPIRLAKKYSFEKFVTRNLKQVEKEILRDEANFKNIDQYS